MHILIAFSGYGMATRINSSTLIGPREQTFLFAVWVLNMTASPRLLGSMFYSAWGLLSLTLIALLVIRPVESCEVAKSPINGSWDHSSLWSGCTGANGLPGLEDDVVVSGLGVAITIYSNTTVKVASLTIATYASVKNLGTLSLPPFLYSD